MNKHSEETSSRPLCESDAREELRLNQRWKLYRLPELQAVFPAAILAAILQRNEARNVSKSYLDACIADNTTTPYTGRLTDDFDPPSSMSFIADGSETVCSVLERLTRM